MKVREQRAWTLAPLLVALSSLALAQGKLLDGPSWTAESNKKNAYFGRSAASAGDVNGDGIDDVIVGAVSFSNGENHEGRAFLYLGSTGGLSLSPAWTAESDQPLAGFGGHVASAGDVNGDGFDDVVVGAAGFDNGHVREGRVSLFLGSASGLSLVADWTAYGGQADARFGQSVESAGDVNGDGFDDIVVGVPSFENGQPREGRVYVYFGSANGPSLTPDWTAEGDQETAYFGESVASAGDVNGDGFDDVIVGAPFFDGGFSNEGRAFLYFGSANGLSLVADWTAEGGQTEARFGYHVASAGDVDGDGFDDIAVGAVGFDNGLEEDAGRALVYLGSASGPSLTAGWTVEGEQSQTRIGWSIAGAGDVDGDGFDDVIVGAIGYGQASEGGAFLYMGSATGLSPTAVWTAESNEDGAWFGWSVAGAGDVNGDGLADVIVGAPRFSAGQFSEGRAFLYQGDAEPLGTSYCTSSVNSSANVAVITASGSELVLDQQVLLRALGCPAGVPGIFYFGTTSISVPFGDGFRCASGSIRRVHDVVTTDPSGVASHLLDFAAPYASSIVSGADLRFQYMFRDVAAGMSGFNLSNGLRIAFQ